MKMIGMQSHLTNCPARHSSAMITMVLALTLSSSLTKGDRLGIPCTDIGAFYCHNGDPSSFTRCIDHQLYLFHCPHGLHFSTLSQTCDWPESADCGSFRGTDDEGYKHVGSNEGYGHGSSNEGYGHGNSNEGYGQGSTNEGYGHNGGEDWQTHSQGHQNNVHSYATGSEDKDGLSAVASVISADEQRQDQSNKVSSDIRLRDSGKPWWRPDNMDPKLWEDVNDLLEIPFDGSVSVSASVSGKKQAGGKKSSRKEIGREKKGSLRKEGDKEKSAKGEGHGHSHLPVVSHTAEKRPELENIQWHDGPCNPSECKPPSCRCPGTDIPGGLPAKSTPQMVMLTFDDEVSAAYYGYFQRLFRPGRYNPNGCPVRGCLYASGSGTDYDLVYPLYAMGVEIASHTLSHKFPHTWWATASYQEYVDEMEGMRRALSSNAGIPYEQIKGFRVPFLQLGADNMYKALYDNKFLYDSSMFTGSVWEGSDPVWPFTLDYTVPEQFCQHDPCPLKQYPGLWEIPVQRWYGVDGHSCAMPDGCTASADVEEDLEFFRSNFKRYYESNRAPFGIFIHARWFHTEHHLDALDRFIDELMQLEDVYIVTPSQVIEWMKNPTPLQQINYFKPWSCEGSLSADDQRR